MRRTLILAVVLMILVFVAWANATTVGHWRFDDAPPGSAAGTLVTDVNSPTLDGTAQPTGATFSADVPSQGRMRSGVVNQSSLSFPLNTGVQVAYGSDDPLLRPASFTIEAFVKTTMTTPTYPAIVEKVRGPGGDTWSLGLAGGFEVFTRFDTTGGSNQNTAGGPPLNDGLWHHVAMTYDGTTGTATLYADYQNVASKTMAGALQHQFGLDIAGASGGHRAYTGLIDEVRFSDTVLTPGQFQHPVASPVRENSSREMTAGDFNGDGIADVALIRESGAVHIQPSGGWAGLPGGYIPGATATAVTAADLDGDSIAEVVFVNAATKQLQSYSAVTGTITNWGSPTGTGVTTISAGDADGDGRHEIMVNRGDNTQLYILQPETGAYASAGGGSLARFTSSELIAGNSGAEFVGRGSGPVYYYDFDTDSWTGIGGVADEVVAGNYHTSDDVDEIYVNNTSKQLFIWNQSVIGYKLTAGSGETLGSGSMDPALGGKELFYVIGSLPASRILYESNTNWTETSPGGYHPLPGAGNWGWIDYLLADIDGDGLDELIARKVGDDAYVYLYEHGFEDFERQGLIPEPASALLLLAGLGALLRRRRSR